MAYIVEINNVTVTRSGREILKNISLAVEACQCIGVRGANGAGKTTLLHLINGLVTPSFGDVSLFGQELTTQKLRERRIEIGYVPQHFDTAYEMPVRVKDVVLMGCYGRIGFFHFPDRFLHIEALNLMERLEVAHLAKRPFGHISGGERQKVMIARALMQRPKILLLDEPFASLSDKATSAASALILDIHREKQLTTFMISHEISLLEKLCDRIITVEEGSVIERN
ncbi:MAG: metal ABC transporter ATP-binding protein [Candidatus Ratteibacteria bacterium]|jgi:ABC-type Mn2+/Zn2+ transport system ATPase subunit